MTELQERARARLRELEEKRSDPRFRRALGALVRAGLLTSTLEGLPAPTRVRLSELLFAGDAEPRVLELVPALVLKRTQLVRVPKTLPEDLRRVVDAVRHGRPLPAFRGVAPGSYLPWIERLGRAGRGRAVPKSFRLRPEDLRRLRELKARTGAASETEVLREALASYERSLGEPRG